jgi:uncharacterized protein (DUF2141 family)
MFKKLLFVCALFWLAVNSFAANIQTTIEINNVVVDGGSVYVAVFSNENDYKNDVAFVSFILQPINTTLTYPLELPEGEYVVSVFQDSNNDGKLNKIIFGIPIENIGITNYNLRGVPGGFNSLKMPINNNSARLVVNMGRVKALGII